MILKSTDTFDENKISFETKVKILKVSITKTSILSFFQEHTENKEQEATNKVKKSTLKQEQKYIIKKVDKELNKVVDVISKEFTTKNDAIMYINTILKDYPQLNERISFVVESLTN